MLGSVGRNPTFGQGVVLRHPQKVHLGDDVVVDDLVVLDAKGTTNRGIRVGRGVFLGRGTILSCKDGDITLGDTVNIGFHSEILSEARAERRPLSAPPPRLPAPRPSMNAATMAATE